VNSINEADNGVIEKIQISADEFVDDSSLFPEVDISQISMNFEPIRFLVNRFAEKGITLMIKNITQKDLDIPSFVASSVEWISSNYGYFAKGYGTHPDARIALIRAITELSQTRAANVQGARDDLKKIQYKENDEIYKRKWQFMRSSSPTSRNRNTNKIMFSEINTYSNKGILDDITLILNRLKNAGLKRVIVVDLTHPNIRIPVVRVIVPGLETFEVAKLYTSSKLFMGHRAKRKFKEILDGS
jgi:ribosomal protein S12 methylthiotransferase accessory factor